MALYFLKKTLLAKIESVYGTDPVPTGAANAILARNMTITPLEAETAERTLVRPYFGGFEKIQGSAKVKMDFEVEIASSGTAGTAPPWGPLHRACGFSETVNAATSVVYAPISSGFESVSMYFGLDGVSHKLTGCRGTFSLEFSKEQIPFYKYSVIGMYVAPTDVALPALTLTAWQKPLPVNLVNTTPFTLQGFSGLMSKLSIDVGNTLFFSAPVNATEQVRITNRMLKSKIDLEANLTATKDWFAATRAMTKGTMTLTHGTVSGSKVKIDAPVVQIDNPTYSDGNGVTMIGMDLLLLPSAGNDELTITAL